MVNVVQFRSKEKSSKRPCRKVADTGCNSPIVVDRIGKTIVAIDFHKACFDIPFLERALQNVAHGEIWDICRAPNDDSPYASYRVVLKYAFREEADDILAGALEKIAKRAYLEELRVWGNYVEMSDLTKPYQYTFDIGVNICKETLKKLSAAGIESVHDLTSYTREEICSIPGMTTNEVVKLEKSLASRGLFLLTVVPPVS